VAVKPFLLLATRAEDLAADGEYAALLAYGGLSEGQLVRHRLEREPLPDLDLADWSGIIVGGGPFNVSDPAAVKSAAQVRAEVDLDRLLDVVVEADFPLLGCCYGIGILGRRDGGIVDRTYGEPIGAPRVTLSAAGRDDPLFGQLPEEFDAFVGHKEAVTVLPRGAVALAGSVACPVQAFRVGRNVYATQFHPELDAEGLATRVDVYRDYGYFEVAEAETIKAAARGATVTEPQRLLKAFVARYTQQARIDQPPRE
jgi:GMP synthase (glutamine-hydrolysing)